MRPTRTSPTLWPHVAASLVSLGGREIHRTGGGSHRKWLNPATNRSTVVPDWGGKDLKLGMIRAVVRQRGLDWEAFTAA